MCLWRMRRTKSTHMPSTKTPYRVKLKSTMFLSLIGMGIVILVPSSCKDYGYFNGSGRCSFSRFFEEVWTVPWRDK